MVPILLFFFFFFFNDTATTEIYTLSLHDALPIYRSPRCCSAEMPVKAVIFDAHGTLLDRKSTRLNSSHLVISYAVFCLKKKKKKKQVSTTILINAYIPTNLDQFDSILPPHKIVAC